MALVNCDLDTDKHRITYFNVNLSQDPRFSVIIHFDPSVTPKHKLIVKRVGTSKISLEDVPGGIPVDPVKIPPDTGKDDSKKK